MLIFDAHLDLSLNALEYNRDLRCSVAEIRDSETGMTDKKGRAVNTVAFPEMKKGGVGICVATLIGGCMKPAGPVASWNSPPQARAMTKAQVAWYNYMEEEGWMRQITNRSTLEQQIAYWNVDPENSPIGYILSIEGTDSFRTLDDLEDSVVNDGLRAVGPAHYGKGRYALGHDQQGPLSSAGKDLLSKMAEHNLILDVTHLCDETFWNALDLYHGPIWASHHNCRALVDDPRQLSDEQIKALADRGAVIGLAFDVWMIVAGWDRKTTTHETCGNANMSALADHVDHVAQLLGTTRHTGIGTDLDGGFGLEQSPSDMDTIADLEKFHSILEKRGYSTEDLEGIFHKNYIDFLKHHWS